ncbi:WbqC family protein [Pseudomonas capsici]|uniref:WbqC family protein n=1 Tax=Pseudomonas capsici TaxID=2810614 RepID=UPI0021F1A473|nr:WbqC family protein [Pseudomonas capsici]MCV4275378.1 WbqC family protein [Pseudomonas capsici]
MARTIAMMQPYLFPYLGYFQLIAAADVFVLGDDLQYIRAGWVNRNRILCNGEARLMTFPLKKDHFALPIMQRQLADNFSEEASRIINLMTQSYRKAPYFAQVMPLIERLIRFPQQNLALYVEHSIRELCSYLQIITPILRGSDVKLASCTDKQDRVINIAHTFSATTVLNPIGGMTLYDRDHFAHNGLLLRFFKMDPIVYPQYADPFVANLSIIDVLMFNSLERVQELLTRYSDNESVAANDAYIQIGAEAVSTLSPQLAVE